MSLNYDANVYLSVTFSSSSPFYRNPSGLASSHPAVNHVGMVGQLEDVQLFSVPKAHWDSSQQDIMSFLKNGQGVQRVDVQSLKQRSKRSDEL
jgi:hypothetical protein